MALDLPKGSENSPLSVGQQYSPTGTDKTYEWDGNGWKDVTSNPSPPPAISETTSLSAPSSPSNGDKWIDSSTGRKYTYVTEETAWIEL